MSSNKRPRTEIGMCDDRISGLPDSLLLHILSFLETKHVVVTCVLSKRWRTLWRFLRKLDFYDGRFRSVESFVQFVDAALLLVHSNSVQVFVLKCGRFTLPPVKMYIWVNKLVSYKLTHLEIDLSNTWVILSSSIFMCSTLSVLKLTGMPVSNLSLVDLPSLKVLHLKRIAFPYSECAVRLLSNCVLLEELVINHMVIPFKSDSLCRIARFEHLLFADVPAFLIPMEALSNVRFLYLRGLQVDCNSYIDRNIVELLLGFPKLQSLIIHKLYDYHSESVDEALMNFSTPEVPPRVSPQLKEFAVFGFEGSKLEFEIVKFIMENATVLRTVMVGSSGTCERDDLQMLRELSSYPRCSANCRLIFDNFGENTEKALKKYLTIRK